MRVEFLFLSSGVKPFFFVLFLKVVYFAATFPYAILFILLVTGLLQNGSMDGILYFITPTWDKLLDIKVGAYPRNWLSFVPGPSIYDNVQEVVSFMALSVWKLSSRLFTESRVGLHFSFVISSNVRANRNYQE
jgi:hypothetical protein